MYKKFASIFLMVSLSLIIFNISYAATFTFEEGKYQVYAKYYSESNYDLYIENLNNLENLTPNYSSPALPDLTIDDSLLEKYPYILFYDNTCSGTSMKYLFILSDVPLLAANGNNVNTKGYLINGSLINLTPADTLTNYMYAYYSHGSWALNDVKSVSDRTPVGGATSCRPIYYANYDVYHYLNDTLVYKASSSEVEVPSMENPLTNEEILSLVNELLLSEAAMHRPDGYNKLFIQYDTELSAYFAFFYPEEAVVKGSIRPLEVSGLEYDTYLLYGSQSVGFWEKFFDASASEINFNYYVCWKGTYENAPTWDFYNNLNNIDIMQNYYNCETQPIVYTSHDLGFVLWYLDEDGNPVDDSVNSIPTTEVTDENGNKVDFVFPEVVDDDPNVLMFVGTFLRVILALFNVLVRFIVFITTLMAIQPDSSLLLPEFVQGIDWIKAVDINGISVFAFFQISIIIAFGICVVRFIKEAFAE